MQVFLSNIFEINSLWFILVCIHFCSVISFLVSSVIGALLTVALAAIAAVDLGSIYKCPKEDYRTSPFYPAYCSKYSNNKLNVLSLIKLFNFFLDPYYAPRIVQAGWGIVITSLIQLIASVCSIYICMRIIYRSDSSPTPAVNIFPVAFLLEKVLRNSVHFF